MKTPRIRAFRTTRFKSTTFLNSEYIPRTVSAACITLGCYGDARAGIRGARQVLAQLFGRHFGLCSASFETACPF